jgi:glycosyltransferase involved in cell wall biosynthesis
VRVAVDGRSLRPGAAHRRGVARYLRCLLEALAEVEPEDEYMVLVAGADDPLPVGAPNVRTVRSRVPGRALFGAAAVVGGPRLDRLAGGCDVAWAPAVAPLAVSGGVPLVLTVHDMSFEHPADYAPYERLWHRLARPERLARRATRVICPSGPVREAALARWGLAPERVRVVRSGAGKAPGAARALAALPRGVAPPFVLAVGALEPRKLPQVLVEAHALACSRGLRAGLVFAGDGPLRGELERSQAIVLGHVSDEVLEALYGEALALACVSREEGFGFTPVEALARGTPVVVAELPVFAETLGDGAVRVPPGDADALADALLRLERDEELPRRLVAAGREAVADLSWERAARETRAILAEAAAVTRAEAAA